MLSNKTVQKASAFVKIIFFEITENGSCEAVCLPVVPELILTLVDAVPRATSDVHHVVSVQHAELLLSRRQSSNLKVKIINIILVLPMMKLKVDMFQANAVFLKRSVATHLSDTFTTILVLV